MASPPWYLCRANNAADLSFTALLAQKEEKKEKEKTYCVKMDALLVPSLKSAPVK